jgi:hypothetical protein
MRHCKLQFAILSGIFLSGTPGFVVAADSPEAPLVGRKEPFCGAVGSGRFKVSMSASPKSLQAGDPILLTIRIEALGASTKPPERPNLANKPEYRKFQERFYIDNAQERPTPADGAWEFDFHLRPKSELVKEIPSLVIVYFRPGFTPPEKGYMTTTAPAIPVQVTSRAKVQTSEIQGQSTLQSAPDYLYQIITGPEVLKHESDAVFPNIWVLVLLSLAPPALSIGWFLFWKRRYPNQARMSRLRKSRAARQALLALIATDGATGQSREAARSVANVLTHYLQERLDLGDVQTGPADIAFHLSNKGISADLADRTLEIFRACDTVRFSPPHQQGVSLPVLRAETADLIVALESQP